MQLGRDAFGGNGRFGGAHDFGLRHLLASSFGLRGCGLTVRWHGLCGAENDAALMLARFDLTRDFTLCDPGHDVGVRLWRFGTKITVFGSKIAEIFGNGLHCLEGIVEPFERARKSAIGDRKNFICCHHKLLVLCRVAAPFTNLSRA